MYILHFIAMILLTNVNSQSITLSGGSTSFEGRLEVYFYKSGCWLFCENRWEWGTVCDDYFDMNDANVACRSLGYVGAASYSTWGGGSGPIWIDDLHCSGSESQIWYCSSQKWDISNCGHGEDVGVVCDINHCSYYAPCQNGAACTDGVGTYYCTCVLGYTGTNCETNIDECASGPCQNGAPCVDLINQYTCSCIPGYVGTHCETDVNECASGPCQQDGACVNEINQYTCQCVSGTEGTNCEIETDECASSPCQNGGTCTDLFDRFVCACLPWYYEYNCASLDGSYSFSTLTKFKNHALVDKAYSIAQARSEIECLQKCLGMADCQSVNFKSATGTCEIASVTKSDHASNYISSSASAYFEYKP